MYLAIDKNFMNKGFGSEVIKTIDDVYNPKAIYFSVEKPNGVDENRIKRIFLPFHLLLSSSYYCSTKGLENQDFKYWKFLFLETVFLSNMTETVCLIKQLFFYRILCLQRL